MPCGCFGGGKKKEGSSPRAGSEAPPKPPKLLTQEEPIKQQVQSLQETTGYPPTTDAPLLENGKTGSNGPCIGAANGSVNNTPAPANVNSGNTVCTPDDKVIKDAVDGTGPKDNSTKSSGAKSRADLYAKRREFFRPLYDVNVISPSQRFSTPRTSNTLPARGRKAGYFVGEGGINYSFVENGGSYGDDGMHYNDEKIASGHVYRLNEGNVVSRDQLTVDEDGRVIERPPRPTSQPSALAGEWDELGWGQQPLVPNDEFHRKHNEIVMKHTNKIPTPPKPPPPAKVINPHFIEFQEKHHQIVNDPEHNPHHHRSSSLTEDQKQAINQLTEVEKLHNEVRLHYERRVKRGPVDVDSLVEKYTEDRWTKMVEKWESEGLVVQGGMVIVDEGGNVVERVMKKKPIAGSGVAKVKPDDLIAKKAFQVIENVEALGEDTSPIEINGDTIVKVIERHSEVIHDGERIGVFKHTEKIVVETTFSKEEFPTQESTMITTIVTPPTPSDIITVTPLAQVTEEDITQFAYRVEQEPSPPEQSLTNEHNVEPQMEDIQTNNNHCQGSNELTETQCNEKEIEREVTEPTMKFEPEIVAEQLNERQFEIEPVLEPIVEDGKTEYKEQCDERKEQELEHGGEQKVDELDERNQIIDSMISEEVPQTHDSHVPRESQESSHESHEPHESHDIKEDESTTTYRVSPPPSPQKDDLVHPEQSSLDHSSQQLRDGDNHPTKE